MTYGKGQELWKKAQTIIPGGNQLLSKRSERFLPGLWPAYYSKAKGCEVWDLEGKHFLSALRRFHPTIGGLGLKKQHRRTCIYIFCRLASFWEGPFLTYFCFDKKRLQKRF